MVELSLKIVKVRVSSGVVIDVEVPEGVQVLVYDYDVEGAPPLDLGVDEAGKACFFSEWS